MVHPIPSSRPFAGLLLLPLLCACGGSAGVEQPPAPGPALALFREVAQEIGVVAEYRAVDDEGPDVGQRGGGAAGDFDRDGSTDLFVLGGGLEPDRLFLNRGDGTFTDVSAAWGVDVRHRGCGACVGDVDGDGWLDIFLTSMGEPDAPPRPGAHRLYRNTGHGSFEEVAAAAGVAYSTAFVADGMSAAFGDYDLDGHLDLAVTGYGFGNDGNRLFHNKGDGTFEDVTVEAKVFADPAWGFTVRFCDLDGDRYPELLLVADFLTSRYYANNGDGTFDDLTASSGTGLDANGMGQAVGDFDGDGRMDWFVTSIRHPRGPTGNMLYRNLGGHRFEEISFAAGVEDAGYGWGAAAFDCNLDGHLDLAVANGWFGGQGGSSYEGQLARLFLNKGDGTFLDQAEVCGIGYREQGRGIFDIDLEGDGDRDLVMLTFGGAVAVFRNETPRENHALRLFFDTTGVPGLAPDGFGTRVEARVGGRTLMRSLDGGSNYLSQAELSIHLGLGAHDQVDELQIHWADGRVDTLHDVAADDTLTLRPGP